MRYTQYVESVREEMFVFFDICSCVVKQSCETCWEIKLNPIQHFATFANVKLVNVTF